MRPIPSVSLGASGEPTCGDETIAHGYALEAHDDSALLALMLERSLREGAPTRVANALLERFGTLGDVAAAHVPELARIAGLETEMIKDIKLLRELSIRLARSEACRRPVLSCFSALIAYARTAVAHLPCEQFRVLYLDRRNILMRDEWTADGTVDHAPVYPREVVRRALEISASALILVHNHPSGDPTPSRADIDMTRKVIDAARVFDIQVHDHLVVGRDGTASFRTLGLI